MAELRCLRIAPALVGAVCAWPVVAQPEQVMELPSCARGSPALRVPVSAERAALDGADRRHFHQAAQARYPMYQQGGMVPAQVLLLRRGGQWQYMTLWHDGTGPCVSAVFAAERFSFTPAWLGKYKPRAAEAAD